MGLVLIVTNLLVVVVVDDKIDDMSLDLQRETVAEEKEDKRKHGRILTKAGSRKINDQILTKAGRH